MIRPFRRCAAWTRGHARRFAVLLVALAGLAAAPVADAGQVDLELVLAVDASSSVDDLEFQLQMDGLAKAFRHPKVIEAITAATPGGLAVTLVQWSGIGIRSRAVDWMVVRDAFSSVAFAAEIDQAPRIVAGGATALGNAISYATALLQTNLYQGKRRIIDVSGDGINNEGEYAATARHRAVEAGITVNGLAILNDEPNLARYYLAGVVGGPGAFVLTAVDFADFALAIRQKLIMEITGGSISEAPRPARTKTAAAPTDPASP